MTKNRPPTKPSTSSQTTRDTAAAVTGGRVWMSRGPATGDGHAARDTQITSAAPAPHVPDSGPTSPPVSAAVGDHTTSNGQGRDDTQTRSAVAGLLADPFLALLAATVDDAEDVREKAEAHMRELLDPDLHDRGENDPDVKTYTAVVAGAQAYEDSVVKALKKAMRQHPLAPWMTRTPGVGDKQFARLLGSIGDPYWHSRDDRPRLVSELWAYCGFHVIRKDDPTLIGWLSGVAPKRQRGVQGNWNEEARMRCRLIAESCLKARTSPYQPVYYETRKKYSEAVHVHPCNQCGAKGKPAQPGTPLKLGHQHARALRMVAKTFLKDLWHEAQRLHDQAAGPSATAARRLGTTQPIVSEPTQPLVAAPKQRAARDDTTPITAPTSENGQASRATQSVVPGPQQRIDDYVQRVVAEAPPLTPEQSARITALFSVSRQTTTDSP